MTGKSWNHPKNFHDFEYMYAFCTDEDLYRMQHDWKLLKDDSKITCVFKDLPVFDHDTENNRKVREKIKSIQDNVKKAEMIYAKNKKK